MADSRQSPATLENLEAIRGLTASKGWKLLASHAAQRVKDLDGAARSAGDPFQHGTKAGAADALQWILDWPRVETDRIAAELKERHEADGTETV